MGNQPKQPGYISLYHYDTSWKALLKCNLIHVHVDTRRARSDVETGGEHDLSVLLHDITELTPPITSL